MWLLKFTRSFSESNLAISSEESNFSKAKEKQNSANCGIAVKHGAKESANVSLVIGFGSCVGALKSTGK
jgi:hypothetical protein